MSDFCKDTVSTSFFFSFFKFFFSFFECWLGFHLSSFNLGFVYCTEKNEKLFSLENKKLKKK
jgi:hypothetical protein